MSTARASRKDDMQKILHDFIAEHGHEPVDPDEVYLWAKRKKLWEPAPKTQRQLFREELARAARDETIIDEQGREVRRNHAVIRRVNGEQLVLWAEIQDAPEEHMQLSFQQRRRGIGGDVRRLKTDIDSYNDNNRHGASIQLSFNFDAGLADEQQSGEYDDTPPDDDSE